MATPRTSSEIATIEERIARQRTVLTPTEHQLAEILSADPTSWAFATVAELAELAGTSGPTVVRFAVTLGFVGFGELQQQIRNDVTARLRRPSDRMRQPTDRLDRSPVVDAISATFELLDERRVDAIAATLANARDRVWIVASESSSPVAHLLATNLRLLRPGVVHLTGFNPSTAAAIADASPSDAAIAVDFPRYERSVIALASTLDERGVSVAALTDGPLSPLATTAREWCGVVVPSVGPFDSAAPTIAVAELIIARIANRLGHVATDRLDAVERQWTSDGVFVPTPTADASEPSTSTHGKRSRS